MHLIPIDSHGKRKVGMPRAVAQKLHRKALPWDWSFRTANMSENAETLVRLCLHESFAESVVFVIVSCQAILGYIV